MKTLIILSFLFSVAAQASNINLTCSAPDGKWTITADLNVSTTTKKGTLTTVQRGQRMEMKVVDMSYLGRPISLAFYTNQAFMDPNVFIGFTAKQKFGSTEKYIGKLMGHRKDKTIIDYFDPVFECLKK